MLKNGYKVKILNTINFKKSMHYNPFSYVHSEKDILKLVTTLMTNTKGEGSGGDPFWEKSERLLLTALIAYLHYEAPVEEQNFATLLEMLNTMQVLEDDEEYQNPVDLLFEDLAKTKPNSFAGRQYKLYKLAAGFDCWYVAALIFGRELVIHKIVTDKQVLSDLIDKEELFWTRHVVPQIPPAPNGCDCDTQQINQMYEVDNRDKTADLSALHGLLDKRQELSDQIEQMEQEKTAIEQQVKLQMQDAAYGTAPGYKVSWVSSESKRVDSQRLKKEQPDIFNRYSKNVSSRRFTIVHAA